jgi:hypothetical protein
MNEKGTNSAVYIGEIWLNMNPVIWRFTVPVN